MSRRLKLGLQIDSRTDDVTDEALFCRAYGHRWYVKPMSETRLRETLRHGLIESDRYCENGCGSEWLEIIDAKTFETVQSRRRYADGYLMKANSGRLPRPEAKKSRFARQFPQFA